MITRKTVNKTKQKKKKKRTNKTYSHIRGLDTLDSVAQLVNVTLQAISFTANFVRFKKIFVFVREVRIVDNNP
jgi:hypothetical protein